MRILCTTAPWAYGSTTQLITIARHLEGRAHLAYLGGGIALEAARGFEFDEFIEMDVLNPSFRVNARSAMQAADLVLSVMNFHAPEPARDVGTPCILVDGLGWMWDRPRAPSSTTLYVVEQFPGLQANLERWRDMMPPVEVVGPIVETRWVGTQPRKHQVLVNFSGLTQYLMPEHVEVAYGQAIWSTVERALESFDGAVLVAGGRELIGRLRESSTQSSNLDVRFESLAHDAFLQELDASSLLISCAGLRAIFEAFTCGVPTAFLPPQNMSQEVTITLLETFDAAPFGANWREVFNLPDITGFDQDSAIPLINDCILRFAGDGDAQARVAGEIRAFLTASRSAFASQEQFMHTLPTDGARVVAEHAVRLSSTTNPT